MRLLAIYVHGQSKFGYFHLSIFLDCYGESGTTVSGGTITGTSSDCLVSQNILYINVIFSFITVVRAWHMLTWCSCDIVTTWFIYSCAVPGEMGTGHTTGKPLHYKGSIFHRIIKGFMAQVCYYCPPFCTLQLLNEWSPLQSMHKILSSNCQMRQPSSFSQFPFFYAVGYRADGHDCFSLFKVVFDVLYILEIFTVLHPNIPQFVVSYLFLIRILMDDSIFAGW